MYKFSILWWNHIFTESLKDLSVGSTVKHSNGDNKSGCITMQLSPGWVQALMVLQAVTSGTGSFTLQKPSNLLWSALSLAMCLPGMLLASHRFTVGLAFRLTPVFSKAAPNHWLVLPLVFPDQNVIYTNLWTFSTIKQLLYFSSNTSGVEHNPKGSLRKQCLPKGVLNAQKCVQYFSKGTCQNPADTSSIEKYLPSAISSRISLLFYMFI